MYLKTCSIVLVLTSVVTLQEECPQGDDDDTATPAVTPTPIPPCVETAADAFPDGLDLVDLVHDSGTPYATMKNLNFNPYVGYDGVYNLNTEDTWEAVRFDLDAPATVYGVRVQWGGLPSSTAPVELGAYPDFGSNGFDFWRWDPLWTGSRCLGNANNATWIDYVFDSPIEVDQPGLFYIAHLWDNPASPRWYFDEGIGAETCDAYNSCHSALNWPNVDSDSYYNGLSTPFWYDFLVRLVVEYHDTIPEPEKWFHIDGSLRAGSMVAWGDYDNDGDDDLMTSGPILYRNEGNGTFTNVSAEAGLQAVSFSGGVWGDYDNDGCLDFFGQNSSYTGWDFLLRNNCNGTFRDVTLESGINDIQDDVDCVADTEDEHSATEAVAWVDIDADGYLDLYMANHICWDTYDRYRDRIWHNEGDGTFLEWDSTHGFTEDRLAGRGVNPADANRDGFVDIFVSDYVLDPNLFYINKGDGTVAEVAEEAGVAGDPYRDAPGVYYYGHTIGSVWSDLDNDGDWDLFSANLAHPRFYNFSDLSMLLVNNGHTMFTNVAAEAGILYRETHSNPTAFDFDNDGLEDLFITCVYDGRFSELYHNLGGLKFDQVNYESGAVTYNGWGSAAADYDMDGDMDLVAYDLFRNDTAASGNHWVQVRVIGGPLSNRAAIGAQVLVRAGRNSMLRQVSGGSGTGCQDSMSLSFGLGQTARVDSIDVVFPGGYAVRIDGPLTADRRYWVGEDGLIGSGWTMPE